MSDDLFPELAEHAPCISTEWAGQLQCQYGHPRVVVRLIARWDAAACLWHCGWLVNLDKALDEWHPHAPDAWRRHGSWPWYRTDDMPTGKTLATARANAARAAKIVLEQMQPYAADPAVADEARALSQQIEDQARAWLME